MIPVNKNAPAGRHRGGALGSITYLPAVPPGSYRWRAAHGLLVLSDHIRLYQARCYLCGCGHVPMPDDLIEV